MSDSVTAATSDAPPSQSRPVFVEAPPIQKFSWILIDWANSGYGLVTVVAVFPTFFLGTLLPRLDGGSGLMLGGVRMPGDAVWGLLTALSMALMALAAPVLGAIADIKGWTKRLLILHTVGGSVLTMGMFFLREGDWVAGALLYVASNYCFGASYAFFNAYLPKLAPPEKQGSLSGWGFAAGYIGGSVALILVLVILRIWATEDGTPHPTALGVGVALPGLWWLLFSLPAFFVLKEFPAQQVQVRGSLVLEGFRRIKHTFLHLRQYKMLFLFLLAFLLYNDGVETVIAMASPFGTEQLNMTAAQMIYMLLIVQFVAFIGSVLFGYLADRIGNKPVIVINLCIWVTAAIVALFVTTATQFMVAGVLIGLVLGGVQASSRALMSLLSPPEIVNEAFGFFSISGKFASILGPLLYSLLATVFGGRWGILSVLPFLIIGMLILLRVKEPRRVTPPAAAG